MDGCGGNSMDSAKTAPMAAGNPQNAAAAAPGHLQPEAPTPARRFPFPVPNGWFQVAYQDELEAGQLRPMHYFGRDLVAFRDESGAARVVDAHCPHLGAHFAHGGQVTREGRLRCAFHHWEFDGEGRCVHIPYAKRTPANARLHSWPVVERNGLVLVYFDKQRRAPEYEVPEVPEYGDPEWTDYYRREFTIRSCNQELAENTVDPAHFKYVHGTAELPTAKAWVEGPVLRAEMDYPIQAGGEVAHGAIDIHAHGPGFGVSNFRGVIETTVVVSGTPIDEESVHQRLSFMLKRRETPEATEGLAQVFVREISRQFEEDMEMWENKVYWERPILCDGDGPISVVRGWAQQFY
jgi:phenylpropionate dioxygenase-like ring-hydroxylating dioxygenase large terminal subunit